MEITGLQSLRKMDEDADLKRSSLDNARSGSAFADIALPSLRSKADIDNLCQFIASCMPMLAHDRQGDQEATILCRRLDVHQIEQPEHQISVLAGCEFQAPQKCLRLIKVYAISFIP